MHVEFTQPPSRASEACWLNTERNSVMGHVLCAVCAHVWQTAAWMGLTMYCKGDVWQ